MWMFAPPTVSEPRYIQMKMTLSENHYLYSKWEHRAKAGSPDTKEDFHAKVSHMLPYAVWMEKGLLCDVTAYVINCKLDSKY